jgi:hypothetical protein
MRPNTYLLSLSTILPHHLKPSGNSRREHIPSKRAFSSAFERKGRDILTTALRKSENTFSNRIVAAYALGDPLILLLNFIFFKLKVVGSLAHGGFSPVSDVDFGLILKDPVQEGDVSAISKIKSDISKLKSPYSDKLSIFWASLGTLQSSQPNPLLTESVLGRFPPADILDLIFHGQLLDGTDIRNSIRKPSLEEVLVGCAQFAVGKLGGDYLPTIMKVIIFLEFSPKNRTQKSFFTSKMPTQSVNVFFGQVILSLSSYICSSNAVYSKHRLMP